MAGMSGEVIVPGTKGSMAGVHHLFELADSTYSRSRAFEECDFLLLLGDPLSKDLFLNPGDLGTHILREANRFIRGGHVKTAYALLHRSIGERARKLNRRDFYAVDRRGERLRGPVFAELVQSGPSTRQGLHFVAINRKEFANVVLIITSEDSDYLTDRSGSIN